MTDSAPHVHTATRRPLRRLCLLIGLLLAAFPSAVSSQSATPCGVVNGISYPIDISDTLQDGSDDFSRYRERFGGLHVGIDLGFRRLGEPVYAAARGRVTYSDPEGWDTEKGVVIVEHYFPDGNVIYTLYGHMEESETVKFPPIGACVERGAILGTIGWPSRGLPHLHYEVRNFMPDEGGPGYVTTNPLLQGWYHPLDFTELWRARLRGGVLATTTFQNVPSLPPAPLDSGLIAVAAGDAVEVVYPPSTPFWRVTGDSTIIAIAGLSGNRVVAQTESGTVMALQGGRYAAQWQVEGADTPFVTLGDTLVFATEGGGLSAYDASGVRLWSLTGGWGRVARLESNGTTLALVTAQARGYGLRIFDLSGTQVFEASFSALPVFTSDTNGRWLLLDGANLDRIDGSTRSTIGSLGMMHGRGASVTADIVGNSYVYLGDRDSTLVSLGAAGEPRWRVSYPVEGEILPPLMDTGSGCTLYTLDADGVLNAFNTDDGSLLGQVQLYAGGSRNSNPAARLLQADIAERVTIGAGFLSLAMLDGATLSGARAATCLLG